MWFLDLPGDDPDSNYREPSAKQISYAEHAGRDVDRLKATLEKLTVPQQRAIISKLPSGVFKRVGPAGHGRKRNLW
ncbi:MAG: hypothetical protein WB609_01295 [Candidatus Cybelea sp.]